MTTENDTPQADGPLPSASSSRSGNARGGIAMALAAVALAVAAWQWHDGRQRVASLADEVARRLEAADAGNKEDRGAQKALREQVESLQGKVGAVEGQVDEFAARADALQSLYEEIARSREEAALIEVEQAITLAGQQLQLAGNVPSALLALQLADARLARIDRPQAAALRKALRADSDRLAALPVIDVAAVSARLEKVMTAVDKMPLGAHVRPRVAAAPATAPEPAGWWQRTGGEIWRELKGLVRIQRFDREEPALLAPGQDFLYRENLKFRLLNARLALLQRDQATWRSELAVSGEWLGRHFDRDDAAVRAAQAELAELAGLKLVVELPDLRDTRAALAQLRNGKERK